MEVRIDIPRLPIASLQDRLQAHLEQPREYQDDSGEPLFLLPQSMRNLCRVRRSLGRDLVSRDGQVHKILLRLRVETPRSIVGDLVPLMSGKAESIDRLDDVVESVEVGEF